MRKLDVLRVLVPFSLAAGACSSLLGIEDIHSGPADGAGAGADGGDTGSGGTSGGTGPTGGASGSSSGTSGTTSGGNGGSSGTEGGSGGEGDTGSGGSTTGGSGGDAGAGGADGGGGTVRGRVIDLWGHELSGVPVEIGTVSVLTDGDGRFEIEDVAPEYDVSLVVSWTSNRSETYGWRYEGLTRRDPTLQVYDGLPLRTGAILFTPQNVTLNNTRNLSAVLVGPDGAPVFNGVGANGVDTTRDWRGPSSMAVTVHGLVWQFDEATDLPTQYVAYNSTLAALSESQKAMVSLELADDSIPSGNVSGTVTTDNSGDRENAVFIRFVNDDGSTGAIELLRDSAGPDSFTYLVPTIARSAITVAASAGEPFDGAYGVAFRENLAAGQNITLDIPTAPTPLTPAPGATGATTSTEFTWVGRGGPYVVSFIDQDYWLGGFVVTPRTSITLPTFPGFNLRGDGEHRWRVETHGEPRTMDDLAGPEGFIEPVRSGLPQGPRRRDSMFSRSTWFQVFVAP